VPSSGEVDHGSTGHDVDCAVLRLDPTWPLRLDDGWRLCQCLHYDLRAWYWVIEREGRLLCLDTLDDPCGLGRDGFPTAVLSWEEPRGTRGAQAAYLTAKRLRKGIVSEAEWARIGTLARDDPANFRTALDAVVGPRLTRLLHRSSLEGRAPDPAVWRRARRIQQLRRIRTPLRAMQALSLGARRELLRVARPTGLFALVVGPDGSGKSTLARQLPALCEGTFRRSAWYHWRPGLLPRASSLLNRDKGDVSEPHARPPHGRGVSLALLGYDWLDSLLGGWLKVWPLRARTGLVVMERGWWDMIVDPRRYRLDVPAGLIRLLGAVLPQPDLTFILESPPEVLQGRTAEIAGDELERQVSSWRTSLPTGVRQVYLDASRPIEEVAQEAREAVLRLLEARAVSRLGGGWASLPRRSASRWLLPRGPKPSATAGLAIYQPTTTRALAGWGAARLLASVGGFRLLPRAAAPARPVREALAAHVPPRGTVAVARTAHPGRHVALIVDERGERHGVAKVATDADAAAALDREAARIEAFGKLLPRPLAAPRILAREGGLLLLEAVPWRVRPRPWRLDEEVAWALGAFFRRGAHQAAPLLGPAHGDCAPWNLLRTEGGWVLIDWEDASGAQPPFYDLFHYIAQAHVLLGRPSWPAVLDGFRDGAGWVGRAVRAYADGAGIARKDATEFLESYLVDIPAKLRPLGLDKRDRTATRRRFKLRGA
jgi:energy-coupling factor transporter ATP-binding protein EcfA2